MVLTIARKTVAVAFQSANDIQIEYRRAEGADEAYSFVRIMFLVKIANPMAALVFGGDTFVYRLRIPRLAATQKYMVET
jgi:hypothetical protein